MRFLKLLAVNLFILFLLLLLLELALEIINPYKRHHSILSRYIHLRETALPNSRFTEMPHSVFKQYTENLEIKNFEVKMDSNGFIHSNSFLKNAEKNIVFLGGSTTECRYVDDSLRFPSLVGKKLQQAGHSVNTFNAGVAYGHSLHSLNILTNKILHREFDMAVLMHGINDLVHLSYNGSFANDENKPSRRNIVTLANPNFDNMDFYFFRKKGMGMRMEKSFQIIFPRLHYELLSTKVKITSQQQPLEFGWEKLQSIGAAQFEEYRKNLKSFIAICKANNIQPILMTQFNRALEKEFLENPTFQPYTDKINSSKISVKAFCESYKKTNDIVREVAKEEEVLLIDLDSMIPKSKAYLYDMVHLHGEGSKLVADIITNHLRSN